jgi:hypothetical protein
MNGLLLPLGVVLLIAGLVLLFSNGFTYTTKEKVADLGPIEIAAEKERTIPPSPLAGGALVVGGAILLVAGTRKQG